MLREMAGSRVVQTKQQRSFIPSPEGASLVCAAPSNFFSPLPAVPDKKVTLLPVVLAVLIIAGGMILIGSVLGCASVWIKKSAGKRVLTLREELAAVEGGTFPPPQLGMVHIWGEAGAFSDHRTHSGSNESPGSPPVPTPQLSASLCIYPSP